MTSSWPLTSDFGNGLSAGFWKLSVSRNLVIRKMATDLRFVFRHVRFWWLVGTSLRNFIFGEHMDFEFQISTAVKVTFDMGFICSSDLFGSFWTHSNLDLKVSVDYNQREFLSEELMAGVVLVWFKLNINYNEIFID
ncbi:unnamed protein product [Rhizophagus irregularis]|nr:unnamed protein product [Rhizophagus irregularis]